MTSSSPEGDEASLVAALGGSQPAWAALAANFAPSLRRIVARWSRGLPRDLRDDVEQEAWAAVAGRGVADFNAERETALQFVAARVPNAAQRVRAAYRAAGARSRIRRPSRALGDPIVIRAGSTSAAPTVFDDIEGTAVDPRGAADVAVTDARVDVERALVVASPQVASAMRLVLDRGATFPEAAAAVGLSTSTLKRRLAGLRSNLAARKAA